MAQTDYFTLVGLMTVNDSGVIIIGLVLTYATDYRTLAKHS